MEVSIEDVCQMDKSALIETARELGLEVDELMQKSHLLAKVVRHLSEKEVNVATATGKTADPISVPAGSNDSASDEMRLLEIE